MSSLGALPFTKMHGLGNDFIVVDLRTTPTVDWFFEPERIVALCDRHLGIGADGVLGIFAPSEQAKKAGALARLRIRNADGSEAEMCGNGLRCVARYLGEKGAGERFTIETGAGLLGCALKAESLVEVEMGPAQTLGELAQSVDVEERSFPFIAVSLGNPHAVLFLDEDLDETTLRKWAERYGPLIERHPRFPGRTNVEFVCPLGREAFRVVVWERGCGITQACGTGACATAVAACLTGRAERERWLSIELLGGPLAVRVVKDLRQVYLRGPAVTVYQGFF